MNLVSKTLPNPTVESIYEEFDDSSFIGGWYLKDLSVCDDLIKYYLKKNPVKGVVAGRDGRSYVDKKQKESFDLSIHELDDPVLFRYGKELQEILKCYTKKYLYADTVHPFNVVEGWNIQKYLKCGGYHKWHFERTGISTSHRHLAFMTYLNNIEDAGETEFFYQKLKVKPKKGLTLIWPTDWTHTHRGIPSMTEEKYIATGWYSFTGERYGN